MSREINVVIVDDEKPARAVIREYLSDYAKFTVREAFGSPTEALAYLQKHAEELDLLFLDIQMPGMSGFELVEQLDHLPRIIFSTAYDEYAVQAFEVNAVDYLLKPYTADRFREALERALSRMEDEEQMAERIERIIRQTREQTQFSDRMFVRTGKRIKPVLLDEVIWIEADGDYARIHTTGDSILSSKGLGELEEKLDPAKFARIHRSTVIALDHLANLESDGYGGFEATMNEGTRLKVSRSYGTKIRDFMA